jgi:predicted phage terminase large subunit-like protein
MLSSETISEERRQAARTLLARKAIRGSLVDWCRRCGFEPALHHRLIIRELEALERGEFDRLALSAPPGSAKTTYVSHLFPPWYLSRNQEHLVLSGSHTQEFAERKIGRKVRNLIERHATTLGIELDPGSKSMADWALTSGGGYRAVGVGVAVAGERADLGIVEDPYAKWEEAQSTNVQENAWEWYEGDFVPRLKPNAKRVIIQTRFHELDLLGRVIERDQALGFTWRHVRLPMIAEEDDPIGRAPGERLWPEWYTEDQVTEARSNAHKWVALYQQRPSAEQGEYFRAEWLKPYTTAPDTATLKIYGGSDYAVTANGGDYTVHVVIGLDPEGNMYLLDLWRKQTSSEQWIEAFCDLVKKWKPVGWAEESGQIKAGVGPFLDRRQRERQAYVYRQAFPTRGDKSIRAQSIRGRMGLECLHVPVNAPWYPDLRAELLSFPAGKHDDCVDALGLCGQLLDRMQVGTKPASAAPDRRNRNKPPPGLDRYKREKEEVNWKVV